MWGGLIGVEPCHAAICNCRLCSSISGINRNPRDNGHALLRVARRPEQPWNRTTGRGGGYAFMLQEIFGLTGQSSCREIAGTCAANLSDFSNPHGNQRGISKGGNSHTEVDMLFQEICDKIREEQPRRDVRMACHELPHNGQNMKLPECGGRGAQ